MSVRNHKQKKNRGGRPRKTDGEPQKMVSVRMDESVCNQLGKYGRKNYMATTQVLRRAAKEFLEHHKAG